MSIDVRRATELAIPLIEKWEGLELEPYLCSADIPTIGYGSTFYEDDTKVTLDDPPITEERAEELLLYKLNKLFVPAVVRLCPGLINERQMAAIISFTYNLGETNLANSTLRKVINNQEFGKVPFELRKWVRAGGVVVRGLQNRREDEIRMFMQN